MRNHLLDVMRHWKKPEELLPRARVIYERKLRQDAVLPDDGVSKDNPPQARYEENQRDVTSEPRYVVMESLGSGGFGRVYNAHDLKLGIDVAVKQLQHEPSGEIFEREAKTLGSLRHKGLPIVYDYFIDKGIPTFVMEKFDPQKFKTLRDREVHTASQIISIMQQLSDIEHYLLEQGIVHRDVKPTNILVNEKDEVKLLDFGISNWATHGHGVTKLYASPERSGFKIPQYNEMKSEVFILGTLLYEMVTGKVLYFSEFGSDDSEIEVRIFDRPELTQEERELFLKKAQEKGFIAENLLVVFEKAHAKEPRARYSSPEEFLAALKASLTNT